MSQLFSIVMFYDNTCALTNKPMRASKYVKHEMLDGGGEGLDIYEHIWFFMRIDGFVTNCIIISSAVSEIEFHTANLVQLVSPHR